MLNQQREREIACVRIKKAMTQKKEKGSHNFEDVY